MRVASLIVCFILAACDKPGCITSLVVECPEIPEQCDGPSDTDAGCEDVEYGVVLSGLPGDGVCAAQACSSPMGQPCTGQDIDLQRQGGLWHTSCHDPRFTRIEAVCASVSACKP